MGCELRPLEEVVEDILDRRGVTPFKLGGEFVSVGHRVISAKLIKDGRVALEADEPRYVDSVIYKKWMRSPLRQGDVIMTSEAPLGELAYLDQPQDWVLGQRLFAIRSRKDILSGKFLYYVLATQGVRDSIAARASGTTVQGIRQAELRKVEIPVPPLSVQIEAAEVLGTLDSRIDLLRQTNTTLEAIAQALFKSWFVDFDPVHARAEGRDPEAAAQGCANAAQGRMPIAAMDATAAALFPSEFEEPELGPIPKGWCAGRLGDVSSNIRDQARPGKIDPDTPYFGLEHMPRKSIALGDHGTADGLGSGKFWFEESDILFGKLRPYFHKVGLAPFKGICSTDILVLRPLQPAFHAFLLMHASSDAIIGYATRLSNGAKMPRSSWKDIASYPICIPPDSVVQAFNEMVDPMLRRIKANVETASTLANLRGSLLPRLISGKLRLPEATEVAEAALA